MRPIILKKVSPEGARTIGKKRALFVCKNPDHYAYLEKYDLLLSEINLVETVKRTGYIQGSSIWKQ